MQVLPAGPIFAYGSAYSGELGQGSRPITVSAAIASAAKGRNNQFNLFDIIPALRQRMAFFSDDAPLNACSPVATAVKRAIRVNKFTARGEIRSNASNVAELG